MGDINNDGKLTMEDVTKSIDMLAGDTPTKRLNTYSIDNKAIEGVWWKSRDENITFNADNTTDYVANSTYYYIQELHSILLRNSSGLATEIIEAQISDGTLILRRGGNTEVYYVERPPQLATSITLSSTSFTTFVGDIIEMSATISPEDVSNPTVTWSSSDESVASVDEQGTVVIRARGTATITATAADGSGVTASCEITAVKAVSEITLSPNDVTLPVGDKMHLDVTIAPKDADNWNTIWSSSDESVVTVNPDTRTITAISPGEATITVTAADGWGAEAECHVVVEKLIPVTGLTLSKTQTTLKLGEKETINVDIQPANAQHKKLSWSSSNKYIATVDKNGVVTAQGIGTATITATSTDVPAVSASFTVTVTGQYVMYFGNVEYEDGELPLGSYGKDGYITDREKLNYVNLQNIPGKAYEADSGTSDFALHLKEYKNDGGWYDQPPVYLYVPCGIALHGYLYFMWNGWTYQTTSGPVVTINGINYYVYSFTDSFQCEVDDTIILKLFKDE